MAPLDMFMWTGIARYILVLESCNLNFNATIVCKAEPDGSKFVVQGHVYLKFLRPEGASAAQKSLNGRWFAGRQISADFQFPAVYNNHFKC